MVRPAALQNALSVAIRHLAAERSPACLLDASGTFLFVNEAWDRHAFENGGAPGCLGSSLIGTAWLDHIKGDDVRRQCAELLERALHPRAGASRRVVQVGESNTPRRAALVSTRYEPVLAPGHDAIGVAIVHEVVRERPIEDVYDVVDRSPDAYRDRDGHLAQCSCCRRVRDPDAPDRWDLVPALVASAHATQHVTCALCAELHGALDRIG